MNPFFQALNQGSSPEEILGYLSKAIPKFATSINKAKSAGYTVQQILGYLSKTMNPEERRGVSESQIHAKNRKSDAELTKHGLMIAGSALAAPVIAGAAAKSTGMFKSALQHAAPQIAGPGAISGNPPSPGSTQSVPSSGNNPLSTLQSSLPQTSQGNQPLTNPTPSQQPPINQVPPTIPQNAQPVQSKPISTNIIKNSISYKNQIDALIKSGNGPEEIEGYLQKFNPSFIKTITKEAGAPFKDVVKQYIEEQSQNPEVPMEENVTTTVPTQEMPDVLGEEKLHTDTVETPREPTKVSKGSLASSPSGEGEVLEIRGNEAIVEIDGKKVKVPVDELEPPIFDEDEIANAYDDLMAKIPEEHKSGFISWAGYDEDRNVLGFIPRGGKYEELHNITPEEAKMIKEGKGVARTTGETREGLWVSGEDTRGGVISQIIHDRRRANKKNEEKQGSFDLELEKPEKQDRGMKPLFDEMAHARELSREREKKKKLEERAILKKERDEAKKRKK